MKNLNLLLILITIISIIPINSFQGGDGSVVNPYQISTCEQLQNLSNNLNSNSILVSNINCSSISNFDPIGSCSPSSPFTGTLNGNNFSISNLNILNVTTSDTCWGLFAYARTSAVKISNLNIDSSSVNVTAEEIGMLVGNLDFHPKVSNISITNSIVSGNAKVGGLVGYS